MINDLSPLQVKNILNSDKKIRLIDVRELWEYEIACIPSSELLPLSNFENLISSLQKEEMIIVYCHHGIRSLRVCAYLNDIGFKDVNNLSGGIQAWSEEIDNSIPMY